MTTETADQTQVPDQSEIKTQYDLATQELATARANAEATRTGSDFDAAIKAAQEFLAAQERVNALDKRYKGFRATELASGVQSLLHELDAEINELFEAMPNNSRIVITAGESGMPTIEITAPKSGSQATSGDSGRNGPRKRKVWTVDNVDYSPRAMIDGFGSEAEKAAMPEKGTPSNESVEALAKRLQAEGKTVVWEMRYKD